jgi:hypothetical protein
MQDRLSEQVNFPEPLSDFAKLPAMPGQLALGAKLAVIVELI